MARRVMVGLVIVSVVASGLFFLGSQPAGAATSSKTWTSDTDFAGGTFVGTGVVGTGNAASVQLTQSPVYGWNLMSPPSSPSPRQGVSMAYDEVNRAILAFGGQTAGTTLVNDLWSYNVTLNTWTDITPAASPPARWKAGFSYDINQHVVIMYGGEDTGGWRTDLWRLFVSNYTWQELTPVGQAPRALQSTPLVYNIAAGVHILAATNGNTGQFETWQYNAATNQWTNRNAIGQVPPATSGHSLTYDRAAQKVILFGGGQNLTLYGDVYEYTYSTNTWVDARPWEMNRTPNKRTDHTFVFGPHGMQDILFGGIDQSSSYQPGTWIYTSAGAQWFFDSGTVSPMARKNHATAWDVGTDRTIMFGGTLSDGTLTNQTWMWGPGYVTSGTYTSATFDAGCDSPMWQTLWWNATIPFTTSARFKLATSNSSTGPFNFVGWDGLPGTFYNGTPGQTIWDGHNRPPNQRYFQWMARLTQGTGSVTPSVDDLSVDYTCFAQVPYVTSTNPANLAFGVRLTSDIVATFNIPMNTSTVTWTFSDPSITFTPSWDPTDTILTLSHTTPYKKCVFETVQIFGRDQAHNLSIVEGSVPNPWEFSTDCTPPKILSTDPANGAFNVPTTADLLVEFSSPMNTSSVTWTLSGGITLTGSWDASETNLTLSHSTPMAACTIYTAQITGGKDTSGIGLVAGPAPNPWSFTTTCPNPYIALTAPANNTFFVPPNSPIVVTFSKAMDTASVNWTITPVIALTPGWSAGNTVLTLNHTTTFTEVTKYTVDITTGSDTSGNPLISGPVPNPWFFWTASVNPKITLTNPADGDTGVPLNATVVVTFSEAMNTATVTATFTPSVTTTQSWNSPTNTVLTLSHAAPFQACTRYNVRIAGNDMQGLALVAGPVPNPWNFTTVCALVGPANLQVTLSQPNVRLSWDLVQGATLYRVYTSQNRFAAWSTWTSMGTTASPPFLANGHGSDGQTHYYIVRASDGTRDGPNSSMGVKIQLAFPRSTVNTNIAWFSLPGVSSYHRASDIATALGPANIDVIGKWVPARQSSMVYYFTRGRWQGTDFPINPGDGLYLGTRQAFSWNITGADANATLSFSYNSPPKGNMNWISVPYTGIYSKASDIANALGSSKVTEIGLWDPATQSATRWYWSGTAWTGTDFTINPGAGVYLIVASNFTWNPRLITPAVP